jgi:hypothetical protein
MVTYYENFESQKWGLILKKLANGENLLQMKELETELIYCKEEDIPLTKTRKEFMKAFFETVPATYDKDGNVQCNARRKRSVTDMHLLVQSRFPKTSIESVIRILGELSQEGLLMLTYCGIIHKAVVISFYTTPTSSIRFVSNWAKNKLNIVGDDGYDLALIIQIKDAVTNGKEENT